MRLLAHTRAVWGCQVALCWAKFRTPHKGLKLAALGLVVLLFATRTAMRTQDWANDFTLWHSTVSTFPTNEKARFNLGLEL